MMVKRKKKINSNQYLNWRYVCSSVPTGTIIPLPYWYSTGAHHYAQRSAEAPPCWCAAKENELVDERQHHIHSFHQGYGSGLLNLQSLYEEGLACDTQDGDQHQQPAVAATEWDFPFTQDGYGDDALD